MTAPAPPDPLEIAIAGAAVAVVRHRAAALRERAKDGVTEIETKHGDRTFRSIVRTPEAAHDLRIACDWLEIAGAIEREFGQRPDASAASS